MLIAYNYPGNYRELEQILKEALIRAKLRKEGEKILPKDLQMGSMIKENTVNKPIYPVNQIKLKDIRKYAKEESKKIEAEILESKIREIYNTDASLSKIAEKEKMTKSQYQMLGRIFEKITGKKIKDLRNDISIY